jgi:hypothetical protein
LIARQIAPGVAGIGTSSTPSKSSASAIALAMAAGAGVVPPSPPALTPSGLVGEGTSLSRLAGDRDVVAEPSPAAQEALVLLAPQGLTDHRGRRL